MVEVLVSDVSSCELFNVKGFLIVVYGRRFIVGKLRIVDYVFDYWFFLKKVDSSFF